MKVPLKIAIVIFLATGFSIRPIIMLGNPLLTNSINSVKQLNNKTIPIALPYDAEVFLKNGNSLSGRLAEIDSTLVQAQTVEGRKAQADRLLQQGTQYLSSGEYQAALEAFQQALTIYEEISDPKLIAATIMGMGYAYAYLGETDKATGIFEGIIEIAQQYNLPELVKLAEEGLQLAQNQSNSPKTPNNPRQAQADRL